MVVERQTLACATASNDVICRFDQRAATGIALDCTAHPQAGQFLA